MAKEQKKKSDWHSVTFEVRGYDKTDGEEFNKSLISRIVKMTFEEDDTLDAEVKNLVVRRRRK